MPTARVTQEALEEAVVNDPNLTATQAPVETVVRQNPNDAVTQLATEGAITADISNGRGTQVALELVVSVGDDCLTRDDVDENLTRDDAPSECLSRDR